jgi:hypothetical protein
MRAGVLLCEQPCKGGVLDYKFDESLASSTDGPMVWLLSRPFSHSHFMYESTYQPQVLMQKPRPSAPAASSQG